MELPRDRLDVLVRQKATGAYPELTTEVLIAPEAPPFLGLLPERRRRPNGKYDEGWDHIRVIIYSSTANPDRVLTVLAHELGHHEQWLDSQARKPIPPPTELDAFVRGIKWAQKWGILSTYHEDLLYVVARDPEEFGEEVNRVVGHIRRLLSA